MAITGGIEISSYFNMRSALPVDGRSVVQDLTERDAIESGTRYQGLKTYVIDEEKEYMLIGGITDGDWVEVSGSAGVMSVADETAREAIDPGVRYEGLIVYQQDVMKNYQLQGGIDDADWVELNTLPGVIAVADETAREAITADNRYEGMIVYQIDNQKNYQLVGGILDSNWAELSSGQGFGGKNYFVDASFDDNTDNAVPYYEKTATASGCFDGGGSGYATFTGHGASTDDRVMVFGSVAKPSGLTAGVLYYAVVLTTDILAFSLTQGGAAVAFTDSNSLGTYTLRVYKAPTHLSVSVETTAPQANSGSLKITFTNSGASAVGEGVQLATKTIDLEDRGKTLYFKFKANNVDTDYVDNDFIVKVYDASTNLPISVFEGYQLKRLDQSYICPIYTSSTTTQVLVSIHMNADNATGNFDTIFGTFTLSPDAPVPGVITSPWLSYTPTISGLGAGSVTGNLSYYKRIGDTLKVIFRVLKDGTPGSGATPISVSLPSGLAIDFTKIANVSSSGQTVGTYRAPSLNSEAIAVVNSTPSEVFAVGATGTSLTASSLFAGQFEVPIVGWENSNNLSTTELLFRGARFRASRNGTNATGINPNGNSVKIPFNSVGGTRGYDITGAYDATNSRFVAQRRGVHHFDATVYLNGTNVLANDYSADIWVNGVATARGNYNRGVSGTQLGLHVSADIMLNVGDYVEVYLRGTGDNSSSTLTALGLEFVTFFNGHYVFDPTVFSVYGETKLFPEGTWNSGGRVSPPAAASTYGDAQSVTLPPGEYDWYIHGEWVSGLGSTTTGQVMAGLGTASGNSSTGLVEGITSSWNQKSATGNQVCSIQGKGLVVTTPTTYYLKLYAATSVTNLQVAWNWRFRKIK